MVQQGGQTSNFSFPVIDGIKYFVKSWNYDNYNPSSLLFQDAMLNLDIPLKINKIISKDESKREATFEYITEKNWQLTVDNARILGESMAKIHNWANESKKVKTLNIPEKKNLYNNFNEWANLDMGKFGDVLFETKLTGKVLRNSIIKALEDEGFKIGVNPNQPKVAIHRDFKKHNIISDDTDLHLIDFDFTAIDYVSLEIMAFITECLIKRRNSKSNIEIHNPSSAPDGGPMAWIEYGSSEKERADICLAFLMSYKRHSKLDIIWESVLYDYISYLCVNTFPLYLPSLSGNIDDEDIKSMANWRTTMVNFLFESRKRLTKLLTI